MWYLTAMKFNERLARTRKERGMTMDELAQACGWGRSKQRVNHYEKGTRSPKRDEYRRLAQALNVSVEWLTFGIERDSDGMSASERELIGLWRTSPDEIKDAILIMLRRSSPPPPPLT